MRKVIEFEKCLEILESYNPKISYFEVYNSLLQHAQKITEVQPIVS